MFKVGQTIICINSKPFSNGGSCVYKIYDQFVIKGLWSQNEIIINHPVYGDMVVTGNNFITLEEWRDSRIDSLIF